ncbi:MAG: hypothetical protein HGJ93_00600 [Desulfosarcina sp.]|nr:hypothetical protein [Desulfosarcina sp.]MBC2764485.1 hypothetical protein [Desulfosarcina sp.]
MQSNHIEIYFEIIGETEKAVRVSDGINRDWLPKSQITINRIKDDDAEITLPEWLAKKKSFI